MKLKVWMSNGFVGCTRHSEIVIHDSELEGLTEQEREQLYEDYTRDWVENHLEFGWEAEE